MSTLDIRAFFLKDRRCDEQENVYRKDDYGISLQNSAKAMVHEGTANG